MASGGKTGKEKLEAVQTILDELKADLTRQQLNAEKRVALLTELKVYGRDPQNADPIFKNDGIATLVQYAFDGPPSPTSREAMRCLSNAMILKEPTRQMVADLGIAPKAAERLKTENADDEFLLSRILFLLTYGSDADFKALVEKHQLAETINQNLARHCKRYSHGGRRLSRPITIEDMSLTETLKLMFTVNHWYPEYQELFSKSIPSIIKMIRKTKITNPPLGQPMLAALSALTNLDLQDKKNSGFGYSSLFPKLEGKANVEHIINILDAAIAFYSERDLDTNVAPVLSLLRIIYKIAPENIKKFMEWLLLPTDEERKKPLGKSDTLSSRLLRLSTCPVAPTFRDSIQGLMFELSGEDSNKFVRNVGYGFASGFFMNKGMSVPQNAMEAFSTQTADGKDVEINPITGQRKDFEPEDEGPPMTKEEKMREAEKMFVLIERLRATGVVDMKNPVEDAIQSGRFQELPDEESGDEGK